MRYALYVIAAICITALQLHQMSTKTSYFTSLSTVCSAVRWSTRQRKYRVTAFCEGNPPVTGGFPSQRACDAENVSILWYHHGKNSSCASGCVWTVSSIVGCHDHDVNIFLPIEYQQVQWFYLNPNLSEKVCLICTAHVCDHVDVITWKRFPQTVELIVITDTLTPMCR